MRYLRHAAASAPTCGALLHELGLAEEHAGDPAAVEHLERARTLTTNRCRRGEIVLDLARTLETRGREREATAVIRAALADTDPTLRERLEVALVAAAGGSAEATRPEDVELFVRLMGDVPDGPAGQILLAFAAAAAVMSGGPADAAVPLAEAAVARGLLDSDHWDAIGAAVWALILSERYDAASGCLAGLRKRVQRRGHTRGIALVLQLEANIAERVGALAEAETSAGLALDIADEIDLAVGGTSWILCSLVDALVQRGELHAADRALARIREWPLPTHHGCNATLAARGRLRLAQGRAEAAVADLIEVGERTAAWPGLRFDGPALTHWRSSAALGLARTGDGTEARRLAAEEVGAARTSGTARALGVALRAAGLVNPSEESLRESVDVLRNSPAMLERARSEGALGAALRRAGRRVQAREPLRHALDGARRCGATPLADFCRQELAAAGARPRRDALSGIEALTASERRVADLAAQGLTNRQLAQALYLSPKTIEMHLGRSYRKLGIGSRSELAHALELDSSTGQQ